MYFTANFVGGGCVCVVTACVWIPMVRVTCMSVGVAWSGRHWSWPPQ